ncbi:hypothetical protein [Chryseobacterium turcicum]|uniref:Uncharacterized protein n=1 Tax=Chryseobacterium turcicum TaxID=2898076 RepID=A0A9Q3YVL3_9FLAO|nr:hypothetical protein [Chryseobacterium turcicum]MCD1117551.1 hypothetical protein [Chryseobacterium turcicum]
MKSLPQEIKILKLIKERLDILMSNRETAVEIRSNELYEFVKKDPILNSYFKDGKMFNQFLRQYHNNGIMKQIIPNYSVDTYNKNFYRWFFSREIKIKNEPGKLVETKESSLSYYKSGLYIIAENGTKLRSLQEKKIYENLIRCNYLAIGYDAQIIGKYDRKYVDFKILNKLTQKTFYWEHFGMTNSDQYLTSVEAKIEWYRNNGFKTVENRGNVIYTYFSTDNKFEKDIKKYIELIIE